MTLIHYCCAVKETGLILIAFNVVRRVHTAHALVTADSDILQWHIFVYQNFDRFLLWKTIFTFRKNWVHRLYELVMTDEGLIVCVTDNANESLLSLVKEASTASADSSYDLTSSMIPGYQPPSRRLTTPFSPGCKTPELFTPSSKSLMLMNAVVVCFLWHF